LQSERQEQRIYNPLFTDKKSEALISPDCKSGLAKGINLKGCPNGWPFFINFGILK